MSSLSSATGGWQRGDAIIDADHSAARDGQTAITAVGFMDRQGTATTAAALLQSLRTGGMQALRRLPGSFAALLDDGERRYAITDAQGNRPLYQRAAGGETTVATQIEALRNLGGESAGIDRRWEDFLLSYEFVPPPASLFAGVWLLSAGEVMEVTRDGCAPACDAPAPAAVNPPPPYADLEASIAGLEEAFDRALADLPRRVGVLLGGFDSALLVSLLRRRGHDVDSFSFRYREEGFTQPHAESISTALGARHHWVDLTPDVLEAGLDRYAVDFNQPAGQAHYLVFTAHACAAAAAAGIEVCLTGDGCDGLFLGYPTVARRVGLLQRLAGLDPRVRRALRRALAQPGIERALGHPARVARNVLHILDREEPVRGYLAARTFDPLSLARLRGETPPEAADVESILAELAAPTEGMTPLRRAYAAKGKVGLNRAKLAGAATRSGMVVRSPFMHEAMIAAASRIPESLLRGSDSSLRLALGKRALIELATQRDLLPAAVIHQPKRSPVHAPVDLWYRGPLRELVLRRLAALPFAVSRREAEILLAFPTTQRLYRRWLTIDRFTSHQIGLLVSYAAFAARPDQ